ncbi:reticulocyte-binding protein PFD0110w [Monomorium pharaonis]|uniref:reticulocyte-binding protein PFD0110w n=1 Tax=Monomorium pharaonis TaxID=307658 RepID=UPI00063FAB37|nr:reticulocyte-binding protein PFD0110w [Monomorium pharaonis]
MKEQWSAITSENNKELSLLEEGLYLEKHKYINSVKHKPNCCTRCMPYLRVIFLLEITLFFGWGCYMIFQTYRSQVTENETMSIALDSSMIESLSEIQKSPPSTEMPAIFVKPKVIIDKINNLLEDIKFTKEQDLMQNEAFVPNVAGMIQTNTQKSTSTQNNNFGINADFGRLLAILSSGNLEHGKVMENSLSENFIPDEYVDENVSTDNNENSVRYEKFENMNNFIENSDLATKSRENHALNMPNSLKFNVAIISDPDNFVDRVINVDLTNTLQNFKQKFSDLIKNVAQNNDENSFLLEKTDKRANARLEDFVVCPPYESDESPDVLIKDLAKRLSAFQPELAQVNSEQIENRSNDDIDNDKQDVSTNNMAMSESVSKNQDYFDESMVTLQNTEEQYLLERIAKIKEDEEYESTENIKNPFFIKSSDSFLQPRMQDSAESVTSNAEFQWFNIPPRFADLKEWKDMSSLKPQDVSSEIHGLSWGTYEKMDIDDVIPESQCEITIEMGVVKIKCPAIEFDKKRNFTSSEIFPIDMSKYSNLKDLLDNYLLALRCDKDASEQLDVNNAFNKNSDKEITTSRDSVPKIINAIELQESTTSSKMSNDALLDSDASFINPFNNEEINHDYAFYDSLFYDSNEKEETQSTTLFSSTSELDSSTIDSNKESNLFFDNSNIQQQEKSKNNKEKDYAVSDNIETSLKDFDLEKKPISQLKNEISNILQYLKNINDNNYQHVDCNILRNIRNVISQRPWLDQWVIYRFLEHIRNPLSSMDDHH